MIFLDLTPFIVCSFQAVYVQFHTRAVCLTWVFLEGFPLCLEVVRLANAPCLLCPIWFPCCGHTLFSTCFGHKRLINVCREPYWDTLAPWTFLHCAFSPSFHLQMLFSGQWYAFYPCMVFLGTLLPDTMIFPGCHPAGSLPPFQLGCSRASWHQEYLTPFSTNFSSCLSYKKYGQKLFNRACSAQGKGWKF